MRVAVVGTGYVGLVTGACFSEMGNDVICVDVDEKKIQSLGEGIMPFYEPGLAELVDRNYGKKRLRFTTDIAEALKESDILFIAVGTPMGGDGAADLRYVLEVARSIGTHMVHDMIVIDKSTVPVGTASKVTNAIQAELDERKSDLKFIVASNPEFLKEGAAIADSMKPDRVVIGCDDCEAAEILRTLYAPFVRSSDRFIIMDIASAEMTKYASNAMLATRISFMNEMALICEQVGADVGMVRLGMGSDSRIGYPFLYAGAGYGGSCFPKDVQALIKTAETVGVDSKILKSVEAVNYDQKRVLLDKIVKRFGEDLTGKKFGLWGIAFKPGTDDVREATSIVLIDGISARGGEVIAYDPEAMEEAQLHYIKPEHNVQFVEDKHHAYVGVDALVLVTEWKEFRAPNFDRLKTEMKTAIIFDGRNIYDGDTVREKGFELYQIGIPERK